MSVRKKVNKVSCASFFFRKSVKSVSFQFMAFVAHLWPLKDTSVEISVAVCAITGFAWVI